MGLKDAFVPLIYKDSTGRESPNGVLGFDPSKVEENTGFAPKDNVSIPLEISNQVINLVTRDTSIPTSHLHGQTNLNRGYANYDADSSTITRIVLRLESGTNEVPAEVNNMLEDSPVKATPSDSSGLPVIELAISNPGGFTKTDIDDFRNKAVAVKDLVNPETTGKTHVKN